MADLSKIQLSYNEFWQKEYKTKQVFFRRQKLIFDWLGFYKGQIALEIGCGQGRLTAGLKSKVPLLISCDISKVGVTKSKLNSGKSNNEFVICDAMNLPFKSNCVDFVIHSEVLEHLIDKAKSLRETKRVLSQSGALILTTPNGLYMNMEKLIHKLARKPYIRGQAFDEQLLPGNLRRLVSSLFIIRAKAGIQYTIVYFDLVPLHWLHAAETFLSIFLEKKNFLTGLGLYQCILCEPK
jgi:ubiquinone/menaquinone biosynthesis C-methylase UbiE